MGPALRSCSQFDLLIMDCSQSLYNQLGAGFPLQKRASAFSPKHSHAHVQPHKSCPPLCNGRAIIVCSVQLHLEWQRPRARGRIKDCVQSNTPFASCQRGFAALPFLSRSSVRMSGRKKTKQKQHLFPHVLHKDSDSSSARHSCSCPCQLWSPSSQLALLVTVLANYFLRLPR